MISLKKRLRPASLLNWNMRFTKVLVFLIFLAVCLLKLDPDFGWHLASGQYILQNGIPKLDIYTYTATDFPWIHHEWLADTIQTILYIIGGYNLIAVFYACLWTAAVGLFTQWRQPSLVIFLGVLAIVPLSGVRAIAWTALCLGLLYALLNYVPRKFIWLLPLLFLFWANLHGSFILGIGYVLFFVIVKRSWQIVPPLIIATAATFINPYGINIYDEIFRTATDTAIHSRIAEWRSFVLPPSLLLFTGIWAAGFYLNNWQKIQTYIRFDVLLFIMSLGAMRHTALFVLFALPETLRSIAAIRFKKPAANTKDTHAIHRLLIVACLACIMIIGYVFYGYTKSFNRFEPSIDPLLSSIKQSPCDGQIFNDYNVGGYLIWKLPEYKVYIDGRMPSWEHGGKNYMNDWLRVSDDKNFRITEFKKYAIGCVITADSSFVNDLLSEGWSISDKAAGYALLRQKEAPK